MKIFALLGLIITISFCAAQAPANYDVVPLSEVTNNTFIQDLLTYGSAEVFKVAGPKNNITDKILALSEIYGVYVRNQTSRILYRFDVLLDDRNGVTMKTNFTVGYTYATQAKNLASYWYSVRKETRTNYTINDTQGYVPVNRSEYSSPLIESLLVFGADDVISHVAKIPQDKYYVNAINEILIRENNNGDFYRYNVGLRNANNSAILSLNYTIRDFENQEPKVLAYSWKIFQRRPPRS